MLGVNSKLKFFSLLFQGKNPFEYDTEGETKETKKCLKCLRRVSIDYERCPYCRAIDFQYDNE